MQRTDWLAHLGGSTLRSPLRARLVDDSVSILRFTSLAATVQNLNGFLPTTNFGSSNLEPEHAGMLNAGGVLTTCPFSASFDYFNIHLQDRLTAEAGPEIVREFFGTAVALENLRRK